MLEEREIIFGTKENPLMVLEKYKIKPQLFGFQKAYKELLQHEQKRSETKSQWGYFPGFEIDERKTYPNCLKLADQLKKKFLSKMHHSVEKNLQLAFIRMASKEDQGVFGGFHVDVDPGIKIVKEQPIPQGTEILRLLINPDKNSRFIKYSPLDKHRLREFGIEISDDQYNQINLPENLVAETIEIPPIGKNSVHSLKFWSSLIPHAGVTDSRGHFLISYGTYVNRKDVNYKL